MDFHSLSFCWRLEGILEELSRFQYNGPPFLLTNGRLALWLDRMLVNQSLVGMPHVLQRHRRLQRWPQTLSILHLIDRLFGKLQADHRLSRDMFRHRRSEAL